MRVDKARTQLCYYYERISDMKGLAKFLRFDTAAFLRDKELQITARSELVEYGTGKHQGTKFTVAITADKTMYPSGKDGTGEYSNLFEKFTVKVFKDINVPVGATVELVNPVGTVYGEFRNQLSVRADDVRIVGGGQPAKA